jgi:hypothetical protein
MIIFQLAGGWEDLWLYQVAHHSRHAWHQGWPIFAPILTCLCHWRVFCSNPSQESCRTMAETLALNCGPSA